MTTTQLSDPREFVQYVIAAVEANPDLREPLLRAILTEEFLRLPARVARIEGDIQTLKEDVSVLKEDVGTLKDNVGWLRGKAHETDFSRLAASLLNRDLGLRRVRVVKGNVISPSRHAEEFADNIDDAVENDTITDEQYRRILATDVIAQCLRPGSSERVWVAVEVAGRLDENDISRAVASAAILRALFGEEALPVVAGERIDPPDVERAERSGVVVISLDE